MTGFAAARAGGETLAALARRGRILAPRRMDNPLWLSAPRPSAVIPAKAGIQGFDSLPLKTGGSRTAPTKT